MIERLRTSLTGWRATAEEPQDQAQEADEDGGSGAAARSGAGAPAASSGAGAACCLEVPFWSIGGGQLPSCAIKLSKACGQSLKQQHRAASPSTFGEATPAGRRGGSVHL